VADYSPAVEMTHYPSPTSIHTQYPPEQASYPAPPGFLSETNATPWSRPEYDSERFYPGQSAPTAGFVNTRPAIRVGRPRRPPRRLTTKEEANFQCEVKGCGKLFSRSYNFKAHMETHDEKREYPFPCQIQDCNKKFVRKTDLQRHHQSVHMKERNHKCDYCGRLFARKDTLRR
jgi:Zinc finger, C2H2 type